MEKMAAQRASQLASRKELEDSFQSGLKALSAKQYETAIHLLSRASELDPKQSAIWANLADANSGLAGTKSGTDRNSLYLKSIEYYGKAIELKPDEASFLNNYAICLGHLSRVEEARAALDKAIRINPEKANTYYLNLGAILHEAHQDRAAIEAFQRIPATAPEYDRAVTQLNEVLKDNPALKSTAYLRSAAFASTLNTFVEAAKTRFQDLRGKELARDQGTAVWDSKVTIPGADNCVIVVSSQSELVCTLTMSRTKDGLRPEYRQVASAVAAALPSNWHAVERELPDGPAYVFTGPHIEVHVSVALNQGSYGLGISLVTYGQ